MSIHDPAAVFGQPLSGLSERDWRDKLRRIAKMHGDFERLGPDHFSTFVRNGETLLVTFETIQGIRTLDEHAQPLGWEMVRSAGWSHLAVVSDGDTWFREPEVYDYLDRLTDDAFFDGFDTVVFYGAGPCGYAAAAYSVAAPGATVVAVQPQATLTPDIAGWDDRFVEERRRDFTTRYGYAPDMIDACRKCFIIYDSQVALDAMHAALFTRPHVVKLTTRRMGAAIQSRLVEMRILFQLLALAAEDRLTRQRFAQLMRVRRDYLPYLRSLLSHLDAGDRQGLARRLCRNVASRMQAPTFALRLRDLESGRD